MNGTYYLVLTTTSLIALMVSSEYAVEEGPTTDTVTIRSSPPAIGHVTTTMSVSCDLLNPPSQDTITTSWTRASDGAVITETGGGFTMSTTTKEGTLTATLTLDGSVNTQDDRYTCGFVVEGAVKWKATCMVFLFIVTPHGAEVNKGDSAQLSCVMTDIVKNLTVTWEDSTGHDVSSLPGHGYTEGVNTAGRQVSVLLIRETTATANYTCSLYPYKDEPYETTVHLLVNGASGRLFLYSALLTLVLITL